MIYIKPPRGDILLSDLNECLNSRIDYFLNNYEKDPGSSRDAVKFEYLVIGTALDRIGHFVLRLLSVRSEVLKKFVSQHEATFIIERLEFLSSSQILQLVKTTLRHVDEVCDGTVWNREIKYIFTEIKAAFKCSHMVNFNHDEKCDQFELKVPFQMCLGLVAKREFSLEKGNVIVPCGKWKPFLKCTFEAQMKKEINKMENNLLLSGSLLDPRLQELRDIILRKIVKNSVNSSSKRCISLSSLEKVKWNFPPCMGYLYNSLKTNHRLGHYARFNFSLFLKDIGVTLNDAITFWQEEYSKPSKCGSKCAHSWQKDWAKYTYSIRHLYGQEGKRANYSSPSCSKIQSNSLGATDEGGCPFSNFDLDQMRNSLSTKVTENKEDFDKVLELRSQNQPSAACCFYRRALSKPAYGPMSDTVDHRSPVEYFVTLKEQLNLDVR